MSNITLNLYQDPETGTLYHLDRKTNSEYCYEMLRDPKIISGVFYYSQVILMNPERFNELIKKIIL